MQSERPRLSRFLALLEPRVIIAALLVLQVGAGLALAARADQPRAMDDSALVRDVATLLRLTPVFAVPAYLARRADWRARVTANVAVIALADTLGVMLWWALVRRAAPPVLALAAAPVAALLAVGVALLLARAERTRLTARQRHP